MVQSKLHIEIEAVRGEMLMKPKFTRTTVKILQSCVEQIVKQIHKVLGVKPRKAQV